MERLQQIEEIFHQALQCEPAQRDAFVREVCRDDSDLRRQVTSLLENHDDADSADPTATLEPGQLLGPYRIDCFIAAGGMGEVYRATDTRLSRTVAVKVSAARFSERFEREARVIASLNHPSICTLYDVGPNYLVMEYVEGPTLADRIRQGPIPLDDALEIARQMAAALEEAHQRLIVHRDFKPGNVKIKPDGKVKVLDFGLAKLASAPAEASAGSTGSPTLTIPATQAGVILGTAEYMSPEQARGEPVDKRGDVWAFGVVLWEMLAGKRLFDGKTTSDVLASVLRDEPDLSRVPAKVRLLLKRCLEKDPQKRLRDIGDAMGIIECTPEVAEVRSSWAPWAIAALAIAPLAAVSFIHLRQTPPELRLMTTSITAPENAGFTPGNPPALSPDGRRIVFSASGSEGKNQLWVRTFDSPAAQPLAGTEGALDPFWSPDSRSIAFFADQKLKRMEINGGPVVTLAEAPRPFGGSWSPRGVIVFAPSSFALMRIAEGGGTVTSAITSDPGNPQNDYFPWFLPDGQHFLFTSRPRLAVSNLGLRIGALDSPDVKEVKTVEPISNINVAYSSGYVLFLRDSILMAQPFDEKRLVTAGDAVPLAGGVRNSFSEVPAVSMSSVAREGSLVYQTGEADSQQLTWFDRNGKPSGTLGEPCNLWGLEFSPDRKYLAVALRGQNDNNDDIWIYDVARGVPTRFTSGPAVHRDPIWSSDGRSITYLSINRGQLALCRKAADGTGKEESLVTEQTVLVPSSWSRDGKILLYFRFDPNTTASEIWALPVGSGGPSKPYKWSATTFRERDAKFSPDGHWVAYQANETGRFEIFVAPFPGPGERRQISNGGGAYPRWRADGNEIFYKQNETLTATEVSVRSGRIEVGATHSLHIPAIGHGYDVTADGQRFLVSVPREQKSTVPLTLVQNWTALLMKK